MHPRYESVFCGKDAWQAALAEELPALQCSVAEPTSFRCNAMFGRLCGNPLAEWRTDACRLAHRAAEAGDPADAGFVHVLWQLAGRSRIAQGPAHAALETGQWSLCDGTRDFAIDFEHAARCLLIQVPRAQCIGWLSAVGGLAAQPLAAGGPAHIAMAILLALLRDVNRLDDESERTLHESVVALIDRALIAELDLRGLSVQSQRSLQLAQVQAYMLERLSDQALTVDRVAVAFGMSRRNLYNVFAPLGVTPRAFIQNAKLDRACALLDHPSWRHAPVARIATQCGFADPAHFTRAFHARHGAAPSAWLGKRA